MSRNIQKLSKQNQIKNNITMKVFIAICLFVLFASCKSTTHCDAYGNKAASTNQENQNKI